MSIDIEKLVKAVKNMKMEDAEELTIAKQEFNERLAKFGVTTDYLAFFDEMKDSNKECAQGLNGLLTGCMQEVNEALFRFGDACQCMPESVQKTAAALMAGKLIQQASEFIKYFEIDDNATRAKQEETATAEAK